MARISIDNIERQDKTRYMLHDEVYATYTVFEKSGNKYFQIDTYGRDNCENPEKLSQSLQIDEETARYLVRLLINAFDMI